MQNLNPENTKINPMSPVREKSISSVLFRIELMNDSEITGQVLIVRILQLLIPFV